MPVKRRKAKRGGKQGAGAGRLTPRQEAFARHYLVDPNATQAAIKAGYAEASAEVAGCRLLRIDKVANFLALLRKERNERLTAKADDVLVELSRLAFVDLRKAFNAQGGLLPIHEIPEEVARALSGVDVEELFDGRGEDRVQVGQLKKIRLCSKERALELLMRHFGLLDKAAPVKVELSGPGGGPIKSETKVEHESSPKHLADTLDVLRGLGLVVVPSGAGEAGAGADAAADAVRAAPAAPNTGGVPPPQ